MLRYNRYERIAFVGLRNEWFTCVLSAASFEWLKWAGDTGDKGLLTFGSHPPPDPNPTTWIATKSCDTFATSLQQLEFDLEYVDVGVFLEIGHGNMLQANIICANMKSCWPLRGTK